MFMDSAASSVASSVVSSEELERMKEQTKINFFQVEKRLVEADTRMGNMEKYIGSIDSFLKSMASAGKFSGSSQVSNSQIAFLADSVKKLENDMNAVRNSIQTLGFVKDSSSEDLKPQVSDLFSSVKALRLDVALVKDTLQKFKPSANSQEDPFKDLKADARNIVQSIPELEESFEQIKKDMADLNAMKLELAGDRNLYLELRTAVLASIEKFGSMEKDFSQSLEELGELSRSVEATRQMNEKTLNQARESLSRFEKSASDLKSGMREETKDEITRLEAESAKLEQIIHQSDQKTKEEIRAELAKVEDKADRIEKFLIQSSKVIEEYNDKALGSFREEIYGQIKENFESQNKKISEFGDCSNSLAAQFSHLKSEVVEKTIDAEMNKLLIILNEKLKGLVTKDEFDSIRGDIKYRLEQIRSPELKPFEARIAGLEDDIFELKKLLRGVSQRLPVIVE